MCICAEMAAGEVIQGQPKKIMLIAVHTSHTAAAH